MATGPRIPTKLFRRGAKETEKACYEAWLFIPLAPAFRGVTREKAGKGSTDVLGLVSES